MKKRKDQTKNTAFVRLAHLHNNINLKSSSRKYVFFFFHFVIQKKHNKLYKVPFASLIYEVHCLYLSELVWTTFKYSIIWVFNESTLSRRSPSSLSFDRYTSAMFCRSLNFSLVSTVIFDARCSNAWARSRALSDVIAFSVSESLAWR